MNVVPVHTIAPQALEMERAVLGAVMYHDSAAIGKVSDFLEPDHFYLRAHRLIYAACLDLTARGIAVNILTVTQTLRDRKELDECGGAGYISQLTNAHVHDGSIQVQARILLQKHMLRTIQNTGAMMSSVDESEDVFDIMDRINEQLGRLNAIATDKDPSTAADISGRMVDNTEQPLYIRPHLGRLDAHFAMGPKSVTVIGARPAVGKTALCLSMMMNIARQGHKCLFISLEMSEEQLTARLLSSLSGVDSERITKNELTDGERSRMANARIQHGDVLGRIMIDDRATLHPNQCFGMFERAAKRHDVKVIIIDYVQLMNVDGDNGNDRMSKISKACKQAAKASSIRLVEVSQLKRREGDDTDPRMSDLRDSGQLEADADHIILLGRPKGSTEMKAIIEKNKIGPVGMVPLNYDLSRQLITDDAGRSFADAPHPDNRIEKKEDAPF